MDCTIQRLHSRYQPLARRDAVPRITERLDRVSRHQLSPMLGASLDRALRDDPAVYVLQRLDVSLALHVSSVVADTDLAQRWAAKLTGAILRQLAKGADPGAGIMRFADPVDFRASFILDLLDGRAWDLWFYASFEKYRELGVARAMQAVLLEDREQLPAILAELMRRAAFERVLDRLGTELMVEIWRQGLVGLLVDDPGATRPLFAAAIDLVERLDMWARSDLGGPSRPNAHALFGEYVSSRPAAVDWRDRQSLARGVFEAWRFLADQGRLRRSLTPGAMLSSAVASAAADLDWLDSSWLASELNRWATESIEATGNKLGNKLDPAIETPIRLTDEGGQLAEERATREADFKLDEGAVPQGDLGAQDSRQKVGSTSVLRPTPDASSLEPVTSGIDSSTDVDLPEPNLSEPKLTVDEPEMPVDAPTAESPTVAGPPPTASGPPAAAEPPSATEPAMQSSEPRASASEFGPETRPVELAHGDASGAADVEDGAQTHPGESSSEQESVAAPPASGDGAAVTPRSTPEARESRLELSSKLSPKPSRRRTGVREQGGDPVAGAAAEARSKDLPETEWRAEPGQQSGHAASVSGDESLTQGRSGGGDGQQRRASASMRSPSVQRQKDTLPARPVTSGPTPRQRRLLSDLRSSLVRSLGSLERSHPKAASNALRLYGGLIADSPRWSGDSLVKPMIEGLLAAWAHLQTASSVPMALLRLREGRVEDALRLLPEAERENAVENLRFLAGLGEPGRDVVAQLLGPSSQSASSDRTISSPQSTKDARPASLRSARDKIESPCAGLFLLARAVEEIRLASLVAESRLPIGDLGSQLGTLLLTLGLRWAGEVGSEGENVDPGLGLLAGFVDPPSIRELGSVWGEVGADDCDRFQNALLRVLAGQRVIRGESLELLQVPIAGNGPAVVAGADGAAIWPLGRVLRPESELDELLASWIESYEAATGRPPAGLTCDASLKERLNEREGGPAIVAIDGIAKEGETPDTDDESRARAAHRRTRGLLLSSLDGLHGGVLGRPQIDLTVGLTALAVLRVWARWLRQFSGSSASYLLHNFLHRSGVLFVGEEELMVELEPGPMDFVLEMAGYMAPLEHVSWLENRTIRFRLRKIS